jgi:hypothetical protein
MCGAPIVRTREGSWHHVNAQGRRVRVGHDAAPPCRSPGKQVYKKKRDAAEALANLRAVDAIESGHVYWCGACKGYHLTSQALTRRGRHGSATGTLVGDPVLRQHLERLGRQAREASGAPVAPPRSVAEEPQP